MTTEMELPEGWQRVRVKDIGKTVTGSTPSTKNPAYWGGNIPFVTPADLLGEVIEKTERTITEEGALTARLLPIGTVLVSCIGHQIGKTALLKRKAVTNQQINAIVPNEAVADSEFLLYILTHERPRVSNLAAITTIPIINKSSFESFVFTLPPLPEQRAIASVLGAVQAALGARRREYHLEQEYKAALLEQLFICGTRSEATQETEIGELPVSWAVVKLGTLIVDGPQNGLYKHASFYGEGTPVIRINDFDLGGRFVTTEFNRIRLEQEDIDRYAVRKNDLLINRVNSLSHIGKCARVIELPEPTVFESNMMRFAVDEQKLSPEFLSYFLTLNSTRAYIRGIAKRAVAQSSINQSDLKGIVLPLPPLPEQQRIAAILGALDVKLAALTVEVARLEELFRALLEELLSGRLRVDIAE